MKKLLRKINKIINVKLVLSAIIGLPIGIMIGKALVLFFRWLG
jgi:hypothetical protein